MCVCPSVSLTIVCVCVCTFTTMTADSCDGGRWTKKKKKKKIVLRASKIRRPVIVVRAAVHDAVLFQGPTSVSDCVRHAFRLARPPPLPSVVSTAGVFVEFHYRLTVCDASLCAATRRLETNASSNNVRAPFRRRTTHTNNWQTSSSISDSEQMATVGHDFRHGKLRLTC